MLKDWLIITVKIVQSFLEYHLHPNLALPFPKVAARSGDNRQETGRHRVSIPGVAKIVSKVKCESYQGGRVISSFLFLPLPSFSLFLSSP